MRIVERSEIDRPAVTVWPFVIRPEHFQKWNTKIIAMDARDEFRLGQPFTTRYRMGAKDTQCVSTPTAIEPGRLLELQHANCVGSGIRPGLEVRERITLVETDGRTRVTKEVLVEHHDIPWWLIPIIWLVTRFGKSTEPDRLKVMCEGAGQAGA
jgi:uncharacterized protein YndB with AHSA1/START domain